MKKAVNVTTAIALALAASVTYNVVQHQRAKGIRPESPNQEDNQLQTDAEITSEASAASLVTAKKSAGSAAQSSAVTFKSASYDKYNDELDILFSTPTSIQNNLPKNALVFEPEVSNVSLYSAGSRISARGGFKPGVRYRVRVKKGLQDRSGNATLENDAVFDITIPELTEKLAFLTDGSVFPITAKTVEFPYSARNLKKFTVKLYRTFENNLAFAAGNDNVYTMDLVGEKTVTLSDPRNEMVNHMLDVSDLIRSKIESSERPASFRPGRYVLEIEYDRKSDWSDYDYRETERRTFTLTDFAMVAASVANPEGGMVVFVRRISDGTPVADAEVELRTDKNQLLETGRTDSTGKALFKISNGRHVSKHKGELYSASIRNEKEFAWFPIDTNRLEDNSLNKAFVFTERGIVRPGESFLAAAFIRQKQLLSADPNPQAGRMDKPLHGLPMMLSLISPDGKQIVSEKVQSDEAGFLSQMIAIPDTAVSGVYTVRVGTPSNQAEGETYIRVGSYVPDRVKAKLEHAALPAGPAAVNEPLQAVLSADYYFGTPVPSASGRIYFDCSPNGKRPDHWKDWTVGDKSFFSFTDFNMAGAVENGKAAFSLPSFGSRGVSFDPVRVVLQASVQEPGGRAVTEAEGRRWHGMSA